MNKILILFIQVLLFQNCFEEDKSDDLFNTISGLNPLLQSSNNRTPTCDAKVNPNLEPATCEGAEILPKNTCKNSKLKGGNIQFYRYFASEADTLRMTTGNNFPTNFVNCVVGFKENKIVSTNGITNDLETNQSRSFCQSSTNLNMTSGAFRCIGVYSICDSTYDLKLFSNPTALGNVTPISGLNNLILPTWSKIQSTYVYISGIQLPIIGNDTYWTVPVGFNFTFFGQSYNTIFVSSNGLISFVSIEPADPNSENLFKNSGDTSSTGLAPWWTDLAMDCNSNIEYTTTGSDNQKVLTIQWRDMIYQNYDNDSVGISLKRYNFQVKLYQNTNLVEFIYGPWFGQKNSASLASIGIKNKNGNNFVFQNGVNGSNTDTTRIKNLNFPDSGTIFRFSP